MPFISGLDVSDKMENAVMAPKVLALGLSRCATSSLQVALERLGCKPCLHMRQVFPSTDRLELVLEAVELLHPDKLERGKARRQELLHKLLDGWAATADFPCTMFVEDLMDIYPDAKIILNQRNDAAAWARSVQRTVAFFTSRTYLYAGYLSRKNRLLYYALAASNRAAGPLYGTESIMSPAVYPAHNERVRAAARKRGRHVLEWTADMGWQPLCELLGEPVPPEGEEFPRLNDEAAMRAFIRFLMFRGAASWAFALGVPALAIWLGMRGDGSWFKRW